MITGAQRETLSHPHSICDPNGRVFRVEDRLLRGLRATWMPTWQRLTENGFLDSLMRDGLIVDTWPSDNPIDGFAAVVEHRVIPFQTYPHEWPAAGFYRAVETVVELTVRLGEEGLMLQDGHFGNVMQDGCRPVYVDLTSIVDGDQHAVWPSFGEFKVAAVYPWAIYRSGFRRLARALAWVDDGVSCAEAAALVEPSLMARIDRVNRSCFRDDLENRLVGWGHRWGRQESDSSAEARRRRQRGRFQKRLRELVAMLRPSPVQPGRMTRDDVIARPDAPRETAIVIDALRRHGATSVLCAGARLAVRARTCIEAGLQVVALTIDEEEADALYRLGAEWPGRLFPAVIDLARPTPAEGALDYATTSAVTRLRCDFVWGEDLAVEFIGERRLTWMHVVAAAQAFAWRGVVLSEGRCPASEMDSEDARAAEWGGLQEALARSFGHVDLVGRSDEGRRIFLARLDV